MTQSSSDFPPPAPVAPSPGYAAPPTEPGPLETYGRRSAWPTAIGVIAIVFGALGMLANLWWGIVSPIIDGAPMVMGTAANEDSTAVWQTWGPWIVSEAAVSMIVALLLLIAGMELVSRRRWSARLAVIWAILRMVTAVFAAGVQASMQLDIMQAMQQTGPQPGGATFGTGLAIGIAALELLWSWALPVFMLIWFSRRKIRDEVANWI